MALLLNLPQTEENNHSGTQGIIYLTLNLTTKCCHLITAIHTVIIGETHKSRVMVTESYLSEPVFQCSCEGFVFLPRIISILLELCWYPVKFCV